MKKRNNWNYNHIAKKIKNEGYYIFENFLNKEDLLEIKNSLSDSLNFIKKNKKKNLIDRYYGVKNYNNNLKSHWYSLTRHNLILYKYLHNPNVLKLVKKYFNTKVLFSTGPALHIHDASNDFLLAPHQETNLYSKDGIVMWCPLYDTDSSSGGLTIYENSHKYGFFPHRLGKKSKKIWTKAYPIINNSILQKFKKKNLNVRAGSMVFMINKMIHSGYPMTSKKKVRFTISERLCPLQKIPYLKDEKANIKLPYPS